MMVPWTKIELTEMKTSRQIEDKFRAPICERQCIPDVVLRNLYIHQSCCCLIEHLIYLFTHSANVYWSSTKCWALFYVSNKTYKDLFYSSKKRERINKHRSKATCLLRKCHHKWESEKCLAVGGTVKYSKRTVMASREGEWVVSFILIHRVKEVRMRLLV